MDGVLFQRLDLRHRLVSYFPRIGSLLVYKYFVIWLGVPDGIPNVDSIH